MSLGLPSPIGLPAPKLADVEDPVKLLKLLREMHRQFDGTQGNFDHLSTQFPLNASLIQLGSGRSDANNMGTAIPFGGPGAGTDLDTSVTIPVDGNYLLFVNFGFTISVAGTGSVIGEMKVNAVVGNAITTVSAVGGIVGNYTMSGVDYREILAGQTVKWSIRKAVNAGTATFEYASLLWLGPIGLNS